MIAPPHGLVEQTAHEHWRSQWHPKHVRRQSHPAAGKVEWKTSEVKGRLHLFAIDARRNGRTLVESPDVAGTIYYPADLTPIEITIAYGVDLNLKFTSSQNPNPNAPCAYFVQFNKITTSRVRDGMRVTAQTNVSKDWGFDGPVNKPPYLKMYQYQTIASNAATLVDSPNQPFPLEGKLFEGGMVPNRQNLRLVRLKQGANRLAAFMGQDYGRFSAAQLRQVQELQTYLVRLDNYQPVGYLRWGYTLDYSVGSPTIAEIKPQWNAGKDNNVWQNVQ